MLLTSFSRYGTDEYYNYVCNNVYVSLIDAKQISIKVKFGAKWKGPP